MLQRILNLFKYVREKDLEIERLGYALESAVRYEKALEEVRNLQQEKIADLADRIKMLNEDVKALNCEIAARRLCYPKEREELIVENLGLKKEIEELKRHLNGRAPA